MDDTSLGLYLHFPFCVKKCRYCDFLSFPGNMDAMRLYAAAMIREMDACADLARDRHVVSIFLGGGTPSVMPARLLREIMSALRREFRVDPDAEITMEMNPGTLNAAVLSFAGDCVNRVSLGVQSFSDSELAMLGRIHTAAEAERGFAMLRDNGIRNISLDLMSGIPGHTAESLGRSLRTAVGLGPEHISVYSLIVEEGTPFWDLREKGQLPLPGEDEERAMYHMTKRILAESGYRRYEISNYARPGFSCRHNERYWRRGDYLGFGIGAASLFEEKRWSNTRDFHEYLECSSDPARIIRDLETLDARSEIEEFMFLGLREMEGVTEQDFRSSFGMAMRDIYGDTLDRLVSEGVMTSDGNGRWYLTERGIDVSNMVLAEFLLDDD